jgi:hypothetical protein
MSLVAISGNVSGTGTLTIAAPNTNSNFTLTLPTNTATLNINGPAFSAYLSTNQSVSNSTATKIALNTEQFDTANCFNNTGSTVGGIPAYAFLPNVEGYYQFNSTCIQGTSSITNNWLRIYKNGAAWSNGIGGGITSGYINISDLVYLNGTTDYVEFYSFVTATTPIFVGGVTPTLTKASGSLVRGA